MNGCSWEKLLVVRFGSLGDIIHTLPAVATIKYNFPKLHIAWVIEPRWRPILEENPFIDEILEFDRGDWRRAWSTIRLLRHRRFDAAIDFQGLIKSALVARLSGADHVMGFHRSQLRERWAALLYSEQVGATALHVVDRNLQFAAAIGASQPLVVFPIGPGVPEGELPAGQFILAAPFSGWRAKEWPLERYEELGELVRRRLDCPLVLNASWEWRDKVPRLRDCWWHFSSVNGLIHATRRATAVVGTDSGPLHLAAALGKPGVAIFGPTDPRRNGPYTDRMIVLRSPSARTTYKRLRSYHPSMLEIGVQEVFDALLRALASVNSAGGASE